MPSPNQQLENIKIRTSTADWHEARKQQLTGAASLSQVGASDLSSSAGIARFRFRLSRIYQWLFPKTRGDAHATLAEKASDLETSGYDGAGRKTF